MPDEGRIDFLTLEMESIIEEAVKKCFALEPDFSFIAKQLREKAEELEEN